MGDRVSIQFKNKEMEWGGESVVLFHHWGGKKFAEFAKAWASDFKNNIKQYTKSKGNDPVTRLEPQNIMVQFLKYISDNAQTHGLNYNVYVDGKYTKITDLLSYSMYFGKDENDGDNSDNGHHIIELSE